MIGSSRSYAIGWAHYQRAGGWKSLAAMLGVYLLVVFAALVLFYYIQSMEPGMHKGLTSSAITMLLVAQTVVLGVFGMMRVSGAVRSDLTSRMIESHRLMPVSNANAILGYIFGPTTHAIAFFGLNTLLAYTFAAITGTNMMQVTFGQAVLLLFCIFIWSAAVVTTFIQRYIMFIAIGLAIFGGCTMGVYFALYFLPGLNVLATPFVGTTIYDFSSTSVTVPWVYFASFAAQAAFFTVFFSGACRRYRGLSPTTLALPAAVLFIVAWSGASLAGLFNHSGASPFGRGEEWAQGQVFASILVAMLLAMVPIRTAVTLERGRSRWRVVQTFVAVVSSIAAIAAIAAAGKDWSMALKDAAKVTLAVAALHVVTLYALFRLLAKLRTWLAMLIVAFICAVLWIVPLVLEALASMGHTSAPDFDGPQLGTFSGFSPLGCLMDAWVVNKPGPVLVGLVGQAVLAVVLLAAAAVVDRYLQKRTTAKAVVVPVTAAAPVPVSS